MVRRHLRQGCGETQWSSPSTKPGENQTQSNVVASYATEVSSRQSRTIMLATARVLLSKDSTRLTEACALIDPCSQATFITEALSSRLKLCKYQADIPVTGVGATLSQVVTAEASVTISSTVEPSQRWKLNALVLPQLTEYQPPAESRYIDPLFLKDLSLADPQFNLLGPIDMIIGADLYTKIICDGLKKSANSEIIAQQTALGWIITGSPTSKKFTQNSPPPRISSTVTSLTCIVDSNLSKLVRSFWEQEELQENSSCLTPAESQYEDHFSRTYRRNQEGRYVLRLPFNSNLPSLGYSLTAARSMLLHSKKI